MEKENKAVWTQWQHIGETIEDVWNTIDARQGKTCPIKQRDPFEDMETQVIG